MPLSYPGSYMNRFTGSSGAEDWRYILFNPGLVPQTAEMNEIQTMLNYTIGAIGSTLWSDGTFLNSSGAITSTYQSGPNNYLIAIPSGQLWAEGFLHDIPSGLTTTITGVGVQNVYLTITEVITSGQSGKAGTTYDATLQSPAVGYSNYTYYGADRLSFSYALSTSSGVLIASFDNGQLIANTPTLTLTELLALLEEYFNETLGSYTAVEPTLITFSDEAALTTFTSANVGNIETAVTGGTAYVQGIRYANVGPTDLNLLRPMTGHTNSGEPQTFSSSTLVYTLDESPVLNVSQVLATLTSPSIAIVRGGTNPGSDAIPTYTPVSAIVSVTQSSTTYIQGTDYSLVGNNVHWLNSGSAPTATTTYHVVVQYTNGLTQAVRTATTVTNETHSVSGSTITLTYNDVQTLTSVVRVSDSHVYVLGTDYSFAANTGIVTWLITPSGGTSVHFTYTYWAHTTEGDYVSRDSFVNGSSAIEYYLTPTLTPTGVTVNFLEQVSLDTTSGTYSNIVNSSTLLFTYQQTMGRIDALAMQSNGTLEIVNGTPALSPTAPNLTSANSNGSPILNLAACAIAYITVPPEAIASEVTFASAANLTVSMETIRWMYNEIQTLIADYNALLADYNALGPEVWNVIAKSTSFTAIATSFTYYDCNTSSNAITCTLPTSPANGAVIRIRRNGAYNLTLTPTDHINGSGASAIVNRTTAVVELIAVSGGWETT